VKHVIEKVRQESKEALRQYWAPLKWLVEQVRKQLQI